MHSVAKKLFIKTFGCQMNVYDSQRVEEMLLVHGYGVTENPDEADLLIMNTCHIRERSDAKVFSWLGKFRIIKNAREREGKETAIVLMGCVAQALGEKIIKRAPYVDIVMGPQEYHRLPEMLIRKEQAVAISKDTDAKFSGIGTARRVSSVSALLSVQEGCDKFCHYCVVPYTRGREYSRSVAAVVDEAQSLAGNGVRELILLGQNVSAYHGGDKKGTLASLLYKVAEIPGIMRIRYLTSHPCDIKDDLIGAHKDIPKLMPFLHLPIQSGSDNILKLMNRKYTVEKYIEIIESFRSAVPEVVFSSDFIVGFPGEEDKDFEDTMDLVRRIGYAQAFSFKYSPREGTPAAGRDQLEERIKDERLQILQALLYEQQESYNKTMVGRTIQVLAEKCGRHVGQMHGRSQYLQSVHFDGSADLVGTIIDVPITDASHNSLTGEICTDNTILSSSW